MVRATRAPDPVAYTVWPPTGWRSRFGGSGSCAPLRPFVTRRLVRSTALAASSRVSPPEGGCPAAWPVVRSHTGCFFRRRLRTSGAAPSARSPSVVPRYSGAGRTPGSGSGQGAGSGSVAGEPLAQGPVRGQSGGPPPRPGRAAVARGSHGGGPAHAQGGGRASGSVCGCSRWAPVGPGSGGAGEIFAGPRQDASRCEREERGEYVASARNSHASDVWRCECRRQRPVPERNSHDRHARRCFCAPGSARAWGTPCPQNGSGGARRARVGQEATREEIGRPRAS